MNKTPVLRSLALAATAALFSLGAHAELPAESWWQGGDAAAPSMTLGVTVERQNFCAVAVDGSASQRLWLLRGRVVDGRLVEDSRTVVRGSADAEVDDEVLDPTDFFVQPTAMVQRDRDAQHPRGEFTLFEPLAAAPSPGLWLDLAWHCSAPEAVDKVAEAR